MPVATLQFVDPGTRLERQIGLLEPRLQTEFLKVTGKIRDDKTIEEIAEMLERGQIDEALVIAVAAFAAFASSVNNGVITSANNTAIFLSAATEEIVDFDITNHGAVAVMQENRLRLISGFTQEQRIATREALVDGIQRGLNPRQQAQAFRDSIGLTQRQVQAIANYRRLLEDNNSGSLRRALRDRRFDPTVLRAIRDQEPLAGAQINKMVSRYRERYLDFRAETIARTETLAAVHEGSEQMYQQAFADGTLDPELLTREWITARDERVRGSHASMHGQKRRVGEAFISGAGIALRFPGDPKAPAQETVQCRCVLATRMG